MILVAAYVFDRTWKLVAIRHFFWKMPPPEPATWPSVSLIQPVTASLNDLRAALMIRARMDYPGNLEQIIVCDEQDSASQAICHELRDQFPTWKPKLVLAKSSNGVAMKAAKQLAGVEVSTGEIL